MFDWNVMWHQYVSARPAVLVYDIFVLHRRCDERILTNKIALNTMMPNIVHLIVQCTFMIVKLSLTVTIIIVIWVGRTTTPFLSFHAFWQVGGPGSRFFEIAYCVSPDRTEVFSAGVTRQRILEAWNEQNWVVIDASACPAVTLTYASLHHVQEGQFMYKF